MIKTKYAPLVLFVYNRPEHTAKTLSSLAANQLAAETSLYIFSDGPKTQAQSDKINQVRNIIHSCSGFKNIEICENAENLGLARSVISGVTKVLHLHEQVIVIEDDLLASKNFLTYMNQALDFYEHDPRIFSVTGVNIPIKIPQKYPHDVYLSLRCSSWGWGTWKDRWQKVDWNVSDADEFFKNRAAQTKFNRGGQDLTNMLRAQLAGKIDSWAIRWAYAHFRNEAYCLYPTISKIKHIGFDGSGVHCHETEDFAVEIDSGENNIQLHKNILPDRKILKNYHDFWEPNLLLKLKRGIKNILKK